MQRLEPFNHYSSQWGVVAMATPSERGWVGLQLASQCLHTLTLNCPTLEWSRDRSTLQEEVMKPSQRPTQDFVHSVSE